MVSGARRMAQGSWLIAKGAGPAPGPGGAPGLAPDLGPRPRAPAGPAPLAMSHEWTINHELID